MEALLHLLIGNEEENTEKKNIVWNMIGSFLYAFASMVLSIAVVQIVGGDAGGIFTFAFSTFGQHMFMVAYFGIRPFQITDAEHKYSFGEYLRLRLFTCAGAMLFGLGYVLINDDTFEKTATVFLMVAYKVIDALADTYEAEFQRSGRLHLTGKSNAFRTIFSVTVFLTVLGVTKDLVTASVAAVVAQIIGFLVFDFLVIRRLPDIDWKVSGKQTLALLKDNTLLFFSVIMDFYIFSASKYAIEGCMTDTDMAVYGAIFMPTSVINLVAGFVIRPYMTKMAVSWETGKMKKFVGIIGKLAAVIGALTVLALGGAWIFGIPVLSLLYSNIREPLSGCRPAFMLIILGGALNAYMNLFYYALIIMKKQKFIFAVYGIVALMAVLISTPFVKWGGIFGASMAYMLLTAALVLFFGMITAVCVMKKVRDRH